MSKKVLAVQESILQRTPKKESCRAKTLLIKQMYTVMQSYLHELNMQSYLHELNG